MGQIKFWKFRMITTANEMKKIEISKHKHKLSLIIFQD